MRIKKVLKNSIYSLISYLVIFILGIINRKIFLKYLNVEFLGYEGLFSNIFSILSLAEFGIGTVITYSLYQEVASENKKQIAKLMMMYRYMYKNIGMFVGIIGIILLPFLKFIIKDNITDWNYIRIIFIFQLFSTLCTYFLSYRRVIYIVDQKQFICIKVDTIINIISQTIKIIVLIVLKSYILYLLISIISNILTNVIVSYKCNRDYPYIKKVKITKRDFVERNFFKDMKNFMLHKLSYIVYSGSNNIIISIVLGITHVGLLSNYILIKNQVENILNKTILQPMRASIGNLVYSEEKERGKQLLFSLNLMSFILSTYISISYMVLFQSVITLWIGSEYLLSNSFVFMLSINSYLGWTHNILYIYRDVFGKYEKDKAYMIMSAIISLVLSLFLVEKWGLAGVTFGTIIGHLFIIYGRIKFIFEVYLDINPITYIIKHILLFCLALIEGALTYYITSFIPTTMLGILYKFILCLIIPNTINILIFKKSNEFKVIKIYLSQIVKISLHKIKKDTE